VVILVRSRRFSRLLRSPGEVWIDARSIRIATLDLRVTGEVFVWVGRIREGDGFRGEEIEEEVVFMGEVVGLVTEMLGYSDSPSTKMSRGSQKSIMRNLTSP
jgi:hypothetical protein